GGYHATRQMGTAVSSAATAGPERPARGNGARCISSRHVSELISSEARGAQKARLPQAYSNASTVAIEASRLTTSNAYQPADSVRPSWWIDQISSPSPGRSMPEPVAGAKPSVSSAIHKGCG